MSARKLLDWLWDLWIPDYEGHGSWWLKFRAAAMVHVRGVWFLWRKERCICPGCKEMVPKASASGLCRDCLNEDCQHDEEENHA